MSDQGIDQKISNMNNSFYYCSCYYTRNIYVHAFKKHITIDENKFYKNYTEFLKELGFIIGCKDDEKSIVQDIEAEINRRKLVHKEAIIRRAIIKANYVPFDASIYTLKEEFFEPSFIELVNTSKSTNYYKTFEMVEKLSAEKKIYGFPVFNMDFCNKLLAEVHHFQQSNLPKEKPNSMNNYGILIDELGFHEHFTTPLRKKYLEPLAKAFFPEWTGEGFDSHKAFTVEYKLGQDIELAYHSDNSEVTFNVCLGKKFEGGKLYFGDMKTVPILESTCTLVPNKVGHGILHRGQHYHGVLPIESGERYNLVMFMRSSSVRNLVCPRCSLKPSLVASEDYGDGFTKPEEKSL